MALFTVSGFAGLIYETVWSYYLKLFLGHAAYSQTLVLAIFMGGMAVGAWISSEYSYRWANVLRGYALAEGLTGMLGLTFHSAFEAGTDFSHAIVLPALGSPLAATLFKWSFSALLIAPQSILLGMTFPLMSAALVRVAPNRSGSTIAMLYFTNSLGAVVGVLATGFLLVGWVGLPGTVLAAAVINIMLGLIVWLLSTLHDPAAPVSAPAVEQTARNDAPSSNLLLIISLLTGTASFIYEISWIRLLSLVLGSSTHAFELMLSAFIFGLAVGGLWIRRRIDDIARPARYLGIVQMVMGSCALITLVFYSRSFEVMQATLRVLNKTDTGYLIFNLVSHLISLLIMFPATFCAGMTLPLITSTLLANGHGERSIGAVYAANTVGAIVGVFAAIHIGMPLLGVKGLLIAGAALDMTLGVALLWLSHTPGHLRHAVVSVAWCGALVLVFALGISLDPLKMSSGVYRLGDLLSPQEAQVTFHRDGKTSTVDLVHHMKEGLLSIRTNGKPDASINISQAQNPAMDELTMALTGALPLAAHPNAKTAANVGIGSGMTTHTLLNSTTLERVDTIEIEAAMVEGAKGFRPRVDATFTDPRSTIHIDDAKTFFSTQQRKYDIIVSEPSNPWVSGVSSLFTEEFYRLIRAHLLPQGVFLQWFQLYEIETPLVASVLKAVSGSFSDYAIYSSNDNNMLILASNAGTVPPLGADVFANPGLAQELARYDIRTVNDLELHWIGDRTLFEPLLTQHGILPNSDYFPVLDLNAARSRFLGHSARDLSTLSDAPIPILEMLGHRPLPQQRTTAPKAIHRFARTDLLQKAIMIRDYYLRGADAPSTMELPLNMRKDLELLQVQLLDCHRTKGPTVWFQVLFAVAGSIAAHLPPQDLDAIWLRFESSSCAARMTAVEKTWLALFKAAGRRDAAMMAQLADTLLRQSANAPRDQQLYLLVAAMTGNLAQHQRGKSLQVWNAYAPRILGNQPPGLLLRLLHAHSVVS